jgi:hypothetical protein
MLILHGMLAVAHYPPSLSLSFSLFLSLSPSFSLSFSLSFPSSLSLEHYASLSLPLTLSLSRYLSLPLSLSLSLSLSSPPSLSASNSMLSLSLPRSLCSLSPTLDYDLSLSVSLSLSPSLSRIQNFFCVPVSLFTATHFLLPHSLFNTILSLSQSHCSLLITQPLLSLSLSFSLFSSLFLSCTLSLFQNTQLFSPLSNTIYYPTLPSLALKRPSLPPFSLHM